MYRVWFDDLEKAITAFREKYPYMATFCSIYGTYDGDFLIKGSTDTYLVTHRDFHVYKREGDNWKNSKWVEII